MDNESVVSSDSQNDPRHSDESKEMELERATLARKESSTAAYLKVGVFVVLASAFVVTAKLIASYIKHDQQQNFEVAFKADASKVIEAFHKNVERQIEALDALSVAITSHAEASGEIFPNVTLPHFGVRFSNSRALSGSFRVTYSPYVTDETRKGWEAYAQTHASHVDDAFTLEAFLRERQNARFNFTPNRSGLADIESYDIFSESIYSYIDDKLQPISVPQGSGAYLPNWQFSPVPPVKILINSDGLSDPTVAEAYRAVIATGQAVINTADSVIIDTDKEQIGIFSYILQLSQYRSNIDEYEGDPTSEFVYPVFDSFHVDQREVVGVLTSSLYWRLFFKDILPETTKGIVCVVENTRNQTFTYRIDNGITYLGNGDLHDSRFSNKMQDSDNSTEKLNAMETKSFTSVDLNVGFCKYKLRVYPSQDTQAVHLDKTPLIAVLIVLAIFSFTGAVFIVYTVSVKRMHKVVMDRAIASGAIVSSLFPSQVRDQIYQENEAGRKRSSQSWPDNGENPEATTSSRPIANVFDQTTIMFADMVGFTKWSSTREPVQVFELLETLYQAFDAIAERRKVFKVETIGDCYVAVAGLPKPQENHSVIMVKFADDCMVKMGQLTAELASALGEDTAGLAMRVGLHSGSVTGGVLRGQKSRFQLFGDTMNTASRMESNGMPHRIHVSQETANELVAKGKSGWVTPREDKIVAKGKGELQTYWVAIRSTSHSVVSSKTSHSDTGKKSRGKRVLKIPRNGEDCIEI
jgi:class 3 adenylate cyclase